MNDHLTFCGGSVRRSRVLSFGAEAWLRGRVLLCGLLLTLPGLGAATPENLGTGVSGRSAVAAPRVPSPASLLPSADSRQEEEEASAAKNQSPPNQLATGLAPGAQNPIPGLEHLPGLAVSEEGDFSEQGGLSEVATRLSERVWSAGRGLLTPQSLLTAVRAAQSGTLSQYGQQTVQGLQDQLLHAVLDQGIDELRRGVEGGFLRNLELRYQLPLNGRSGIFSTDVVFSFLDRDRWSIFGQAGGLLGSSDGGINLGLGYRHLLANEWLLLGTNLFFDHHSDSDLRRISVGAEAKSTSLDLYLNWYHMIGGKKQLGGGVSTYTPDGFDVELVGRLPSFPWVELSGRYYQWFLEKGDIDKGAGDKLYGLRYQLNLQPVPLFGVEFSLEDPERGKREWTVGANLKYRFGVPLLEQLRLQRVKAHDPVHRRFERVRREYRVLTRQTRPSAAPASPLRLLEGNFRVSLTGAKGDPQTSRINLPVAAPIAAGTVFGFRFDGSGTNPAVRGTDYSLSFPNADWAVVRGSGSALSSRQVTSPQVTYTVPAGGLDVTDVNVVYFEVTVQIPVSLPSPLPADKEFTIRLSAPGSQENSGRVTLTYAGAQATQIGLEGADTRDVTEGGPGVEMKLTGGPLADAATNPVLLMAPATCQGRLTLSQGGTAIPLANGQWEIVFAAGAAETTFSVVVSEDTNKESETCILQVVAPTTTPSPYVAAPNADRVTLTLLDDDALQVRFAVASSSVLEGNSANVELTLSGQVDSNNDQTATVNVRASGTATTNDYSLTLDSTQVTVNNNALTLALTLPSGSTSVSKTLVVAVNEVSGGDKTLGLTLGTGTDYTVSQPNVHTLTLVDDESLPQLSLKLDPTGTNDCAADGTASKVLTEGNAQQNSAVLRLCASRAIGESALTITLDASGTAAAADVDGGIGITLTLTPGATSVEQTLTAVADNVRDSSARESLVLTLPAPAGTGIPRYRVISAPANTVTLTIVDAQLPQIGFDDASATIREGGPAVGIKLTGGPLYDAATERVLLAATDATCRGRLTLSQDEGGTATAIPLANGQWPIVFPSNTATEASFTVAVSEDQNDVSESCTLQVVVPTTTPSYGAVSGASAVTLTIVEIAQIGFKDASPLEVTEGSVGKSLTLSGGAPAANNPVLLTAEPEACRSRLTLSQGGTAVVPANNQWPIVFASNTAAEASFIVAASRSNDATNPSCTLQVVGPTTTTSPPPYAVATSANAVTLTIAEPAPIRFRDATTVEVPEGVPTGKDLTLTGGPVVDAANNPVLLLAPEACRGRLTLSQSGADIVLNGDNQWPISFGAGAIEASFRVVVVQNENREDNESCPLQVVEYTASPPYTVASDANAITLSLFDDDSIRLRFKTASSTVVEGGSVDITYIFRSAIARADVVAGSLLSIPMSWRLSIGDHRGTVDLSPAILSRTNGPTWTIGGPGNRDDVSVVISHPNFPTATTEVEYTMTFEAADDAGGKRVLLLLSPASTDFARSETPTTHTITINAK